MNLCGGALVRQNTGRVLLQSYQKEIVKALWSLNSLACIILYELLPPYQCSQVYKDLAVAKVNA